MFEGVRVCSLFLTVGIPLRYFHQVERAQCSPPSCRKLRWSSGTLCFGGKYARANEGFIDNNWSTSDTLHHEVGPKEIGKHDSSEKTSDVTKVVDLRVRGHTLGALHCERANEGQCQGKKENCTSATVVFFGTGRTWTA